MNNKNIGIIGVAGRGPVVKNKVIKTNICYFCKEAANLITEDITKCTLLGVVEAGVYFPAICQSIMAENKVEIEAQILEYNGFRFEIGKYYENTDGFKVHVLCVTNTTVFGKCLIAETNTDLLLPLSTLEEATLGFKEITADKWMADFAAVENKEENNA